MNVYALVETDGNEKTILGIFSSPELKDGILKSYYGDCSCSDFVDVRDSGVEWYMLVTHAIGQVTLTMLEFGLDEI